MSDSARPPDRMLKRPAEESLVRGFRKGGERQTYSDFLQLDTLLDLQQTFQDPPKRDELLFILIHQVSELWLKLLYTELVAARGAIDGDDLAGAQKCFARIKAVEQQLIGAWDVLLTMTTADYIEFRDALGHSSGFQSWGYRRVEFVLGNKDASHLGFHEHDQNALSHLRPALEAPSVYDAVLRLLSRRGFAVPRDLLERDLKEPYGGNDVVVEIWKDIYSDTRKHWELYELAEILMDVEGLFQRWRFHHMSAVERIIGHQKGTGGSSGVGYLKAALSLRFFHDLFEVRNALLAR